MFGEILVGTPLFPGDEKYGPGKQLKMIFESCGTPDLEDWPEVVNLSGWQEHMPTEKVQRRL